MSNPKNPFDDDDVHYEPVDVPTVPGSHKPSADKTLLRQAYLEQGKRIGLLERRLEEIYESLQKEVTEIKNKLLKTRKELKHVYEKMIEKPK